MMDPQFGLGKPLHFSPFRKPSEWHFP